MSSTFPDIKRAADCRSSICDCGRGQPVQTARSKTDGNVRALSMPQLTTVRRLCAPSDAAEGLRGTCKLRCYWFLEDSKFQSSREPRRGSVTINAAVFSITDSC